MEGFKSFASQENNDWVDKMIKLRKTTFTSQENNDWVNEIIKLKKKKSFTSQENKDWVDKSIRSLRETDTFTDLDSSGSKSSAEVPDASSSPASEKNKSFTSVIKFAHSTSVVKKSKNFTSQKNNDWVDEIISNVGETDTLTDLDSSGSKCSAEVSAESSSPSAEKAPSVVPTAAPVDTPNETPKVTDRYRRRLERRTKRSPSPARLRHTMSSRSRKNSKVSKANAVKKDVSPAGENSSRKKPREGVYVPLSTSPSSRKSPRRK